MSRASRYALVGIVNTAFGYGVFAGLELTVGDRVPYLEILLIAHVAGVLEAFVLQRAFVFMATGSWLPQLMRFWSVYLVALGANLLLLPALVEILHVPVLLAQFVVLLVLALGTFAAHTSFTFRSSALTSDAVVPPA